MLTLSWLFIIRAQWLLRACSKHQGRHTCPLIDNSLAFESRLESETGNTGFCPVGGRAGGGLHKMETLGTGPENKKNLNQHENQGLKPNQHHKKIGWRQLPV